MVMPRQMLFDAVFGRCPMVIHQGSLAEKDIQPASIDLSLGTRVACMKTALLPKKGEKVADLIRRPKDDDDETTFCKYDFELSEDRTNSLERGKVYIIELAERLDLPEHVYAEFSPKSSTGRNDIFVQVIGDGHPHYDHLPPSYRGPLYLEVVSLSHDIRVCRGLKLVQMRLKHRDSTRLTGKEIEYLHNKHGLVFGKDKHVLNWKEITIQQDRLYFRVDLDRDIVGFVARDDSVGQIGMDRVAHYDPEDFFVPIRRPKNGQLVLLPERFYLLATKEFISIPSTVCGELPAYDNALGEGRTHYAGFFDPEFGKNAGTSGVLEVRPRDKAVRLVDGRVLCSMMFEHLTEKPDHGYEGNYTQRGPSLAKQFKNRIEAWGL